jgi:hypothetical protein
MASPPPLPPGSPPKPPPRRVHDPSGPGASPGQNPFIAADPSLGAPATAPAVSVDSPAPGARPEEPGRNRSPDVTASLRDPHADFRKGTWKKPAILLAVAALTAGGLFLGLPSGTEKEQKPAAVASPETAAVIGRSVGPEIIPDPDQPSLTQPNPPPARSKVAEEPGESPDRPDQSGSFASMFKSGSR